MYPCLLPQFSAHKSPSLSDKVGAISSVFSSFPHWRVNLSLRSFSEILYTHTKNEAHLHGGPRSSPSDYEACVCAQSLSPTDCSPPGSSVHGIFQAIILEWVVISSSRGSSWFWDRICLSCIGRWILTTEPPGKSQLRSLLLLLLLASSKTFLTKKTCGQTLKRMEPSSWFHSDWARSSGRELGLW